MATYGKVSVTWLDVILVLLLAIGGLGSWRASRQLAEQRFAPAEPRREAFEHRHRVGALQRRYAAAEQEWKETLALASQQNLEVEQQAAQMEVLERAFAAAGAAGPPAEALLEHRKARDRRAVAAALVGRLQARLHAIEQRLERSADAVAAARRAAAADLAGARDGRERKIWWQTALTGLAGVAMFLLAALAVLAAGPFRPVRLPSWPAAAVATAVLIAAVLYEALGPSALVLGSLAVLATLRALFAAGPGDA